MTETPTLPPVLAQSRSSLQSQIQYSAPSSSRHVS
eukprot:CAMPEP_0177593710 /NCGR_PEP_ID=MMETSP0419_2-20121207/9324_1 /TAXON_ID=582737 /ORGANISM="Tetraselmis sp., Strain GSL018" /LENGTH=34 /DNA_ID= /DNA_START= /DNA_END= /DNA_ORIENTATION=